MYGLDPPHTRQAVPSALPLYLNLNLRPDQSSSRCFFIRSWQHPCKLQAAFPDSQKSGRKVHCGPVKNLITPVANQHQTTGVRRVWNAAQYSIAGIRAAWKNETAFRQELLLCIILLPGAFFVGQTAVERALLIGSCLLVLVIELLNSAIEAAIDRIGDDPHKLSGRAKDMGSAAVFICLWIVVICWVLIGYENFFENGIS